MRLKVMELENQLKALKKQAETEARDSQFNEFKTALDGKCFLTHWRWSGNPPMGSAIGAVRYSKFRIGSWDRAEYQSESVYVGTTVSRKTRRALEPQGVYINCCDTEGIGERTYLGDIKRSHVREITQEEFQAMWDTAVVTAEKTRDLWVSYLTGQISTGSEPRVSEDFALDIDVVQLHSYDTPILDGSPFMLPGDRHLKTENARRFVLSRINDDRVLDARISSCYQACDSRYVSEKHARWARLTELFNLSQLS